MDFRVGNGYDVHLLKENLSLTLGGIKIEHTKGCVAHSDGDVIIHALCDALLGALSLGDIGKFFPDNSDEFKGIDSKILLKRTYDMITDRGYSLVNADCMLLLQKPKIAPYINLMQEAISSVISVDKERISIKATTTEGAGYIGREEGVAAYVVVLLCRNH
jgi:2-C-methyl-D-erythritol 2,4-cyclodiphosphate synthase